MGQEVFWNCVFLLPDGRTIRTGELTQEEGIALAEEIEGLQIERHRKNRMTNFWMHLKGETFECIDLWFIPFVRELV